MRLPVFLGSSILVCALVAPVRAQDGPGTGSPSLEAARQVQVTARIVVVDREAFTRLGLAYAVVGNDRVRVMPTGGRIPGGVRVKVGTHGVTAFLEAARASRLIRSESTQRVMTMSGRAAQVSSQDLSVGRRAARRRGPSLAVIPTVLADGRVLLQVAAGVEDRVTYARGVGLDGSPAAVETEVIAPDGEELILASSSWVTASREAGLAGWSSDETGRDVLVAVSATVVR
jgi:Flp pilus assembly secretin CpaC